METTTRQGTTLVVHLTATQRKPGGRPEPIIEFRYKGGILCSSYYLSTFQGIPDGEGLCLMGGQFTRQEMGPEAVAACQAWIAEAMGARHG